MTRTKRKRSESVARVMETWVQMLWGAMNATGKGFRRPSLKRGPGDARREDKAEFKGPQWLRRYQRRYT